MKAALREQLLAHLDRLDEEEAERLLTEQADAETWVQMIQRWEHARAAFDADLTYDEFVEMCVHRSRKGKRGRPTADSVRRASEPLYLAAHDFDRLRNFSPDVTREEVLEIAAQRHGVAVEALGELVRRSIERRHDRIARRR